MKKILFYNWIQFDDKKHRGGGVTVYQNNIINTIKDAPDIECYFLSSGSSYDMNNKKIRIEKTENIYGEKCKSYKVVNSPIVAPSFYQASDLEDYFNDEKLYMLIKEFISTNGPFDAIHFNNLEGLSLKCLSLKKDFPFTKFIYSLHNYFPMCPGVNLWFHDMAICSKRKFNNGYGCINCPAFADAKKEKQRYANENIIKMLDENEAFYKVLKFAYKKYKQVITFIKPKSVLDIETIKENERIKALNNIRFRDNNIKMLNTYYDTIFAVSKRVKDIALAYGLDETKVRVGYIGTKFADAQKEFKKINNEKFTIAYMGYARNDKGFFDFMHALELIDTKIASEVNVVFAVKIFDEKILQWIFSLRKRFNKIIHFDGYNHSNISDILKDVNLGVVPVRWEDNLPQVAIEIAANGVPVLTTDIGGANELSNSKLFIVEHDNPDMLAERIEFFVNAPDELDKYWKGYNGLTTMKKHIEDLFIAYGITKIRQ